MHIRGGFTLIELVAVVMVLSIVAVIAVSRVGGVAQRAKIVAAERDLVTISEAFLQEDGGYLRDMGGIPGFSCGYLRLANLMISTNLYGSLSTEIQYWAGFRVDDPDRASNPKGCAPKSAFTSWDPQADRGWRGPYVKSWSGAFPAADDVRFPSDGTFYARGFFPPVSGLREPSVFTEGIGGCSIYGFPGEPALVDPWGNPYVLQIPPAQAFPGSNTNVSDEARFRYSRIVSAGPDGFLQTPCFAVNLTNRWETSWSAEFRRLSRQAGRDAGGTAARGDDIVLFLVRTDIDEGEEEE